MPFLIGIRRFVCIGSALLVACMETSETTYRSMTDAQTKGAVAAGWVPDWLPQQSMEIHEVHNIDTNARMLRADLPLNSLFEFPSKCVPVQPSDLVDPPFA